MPKHLVLIVGGGVAGMRAALAARERGADVALISKVHPLGTQGGTSHGGINAAMRDEDSVEVHAADTVKGSEADHLRLVMFTWRRRCHFRATYHVAPETCSVCPLSRDRIRALPSRAVPRFSNRALLAIATTPRSAARASGGA